MAWHVHVDVRQHQVALEGDFIHGCGGQVVAPTATSGWQSEREQPGQR